MTPGILLAIIGLIILMVLPASRNFLGWLISKPGVHLYHYLFFLIKFIVRAHYTVFRNMVLPRRVIYPTLERDDTVQRD